MRSRHWMEWRVLARFTLFIVVPQTNSLTKWVLTSRYVYCATHSISHLFCPLGKLLDSVTHVCTLMCAHVGDHVRIRTHMCALAQYRLGVCTHMHVRRFWEHFDLFGVRLACTLAFLALHIKRVMEKLFIYLAQSVNMPKQVCRDCSIPDCGAKYLGLPRMRTLTSYRAIGPKRAKSVHIGPKRAYKCNNHFTKEVISMHIFLRQWTVSNGSHKEKWSCIWLWEN